MVWKGKGMGMGETKLQASKRDGEFLKKTSAATMAALAIR